MPQKKDSYPKSIYFNLPNYRIIGVGNIYTGSENTFNYRFKLDKDADKIHLWVWYGMKCFELAEIAAEHEAENSEKGMSDLASVLDEEYDKYKAKLSAGEVKGRPTYEDRSDTGPVISDYELFGEDDESNSDGDQKI